MGNNIFCQLCIFYIKYRGDTVNSPVLKKSLTDQELKEGMRKLIPDIEPQGHGDGLEAMWSILIPIAVFIFFVIVVIIGAL